MPLERVCCIEDGEHAIHEKYSYGLFLFSYHGNTQIDLINEGKRRNLRIFVQGWRHTLNKFLTKFAKKTADTTLVSKYPV